MNKKQIQQTLKYTIPLVFSSVAFFAMAGEVSSITSGQNENGDFEVQILGSDFNGVNDFSLVEANQIVVNIPNARSYLAERVTQIANSAVSDVVVLEGEDRVRATINLTRYTPYKVIESSNKITIVLQGVESVSRQQPIVSKKSNNYNPSSADVGFEKGKDGQGKVQIRLPKGRQANVTVDRRGRNVVAKVSGASFGQTKKLKVDDFGTAVKSIDVFKSSLNIATSDDNFKVVSYQSDDVFSIEFNRPTKEEVDNSELMAGDKNKKYTGAPLSLNFQDIEMRAVLQLIGDFTNTNIAVSDAVGGSITLRMNNVPWDQALDIILQTKGLSMQKNGDVIYIAPSEEIANAKKAHNLIYEVDQESAPIQQQLVQVQYARASDIEKIIEDNSNAGSKDSASGGLLTPRGSISVDDRTNNIIVNDIASSIQKVIKLIEKLDVPVDQVLIDARIVTASNSFAHDIGARIGGDKRGADGIYSTGNLENQTSLLNGEASNLADRLGVNLPADGKTATSFGLGLLSSDFLVELELSAMESTGRGEIVSSPRVIAQDGGEAEIKQGTQIAYSTTSPDGASTTVFKDIPLLLNVKPKIAPNNQIDMELKISKDAVGNIYNGEYGVDTNQITTQVLVDSGETVVLGGIYEQNKSKSVSKVPVLGDLPIVGRAFRKDSSTVKKSELLIFVTPKIIDKRFTQKDKFSDLRK